MIPLIEQMYGKLGSRGPFLDDELRLGIDSIKTLEALNSTYANYIVGNLIVEQKALTAPFFIPFNLTPTLTGISGVKLFQKYDIEQGILPYSYRGKVNFLILEQTHTIANNTWTTELKSLTVPAMKEGSITKEYSPKVNVAPILTGEVRGPFTKGNARLSKEETIKFYRAVLEGIGANFSTNSLQFSQAWRQAEGGQASYNPFNTTYKLYRSNLPPPEEDLLTTIGRALTENPKSNMFPYNSVGVQNYQTFEEGVQATVLTLKLSYYTELVEGLKQGTNPLILAKEQATRSLATWKGEQGGGYIAAVLESRRLRSQINEFIGNPNAAPGPDINLIWKLERRVGGVSGEVIRRREIAGGI